MSLAGSKRIEGIPTIKLHGTARAARESDCGQQEQVTSRDGKVTGWEGRLGSKKEQAGWEALIPIDGSEEWKQEEKG